MSYKTPVPLDRYREKRTNTARGQEWERGESDKGNYSKRKTRGRGGNNNSNNKLIKKMKKKHS